MGELKKLYHILVEEELVALIEEYCKEEGITYTDLFKDAVKEVVEGKSKR